MPLWKGVEDIEYVPEEGIGNLTLLEKLEIKDCPNLVSLPDQGMGRLISLQDCIFQIVLNCITTRSRDGASAPYSKDARKKQGRTGPRLRTSQTLALIFVMNFQTCGDRDCDCATAGHQKCGRDVNIHLVN
ncbi:hypothetical protein Prudu_005140 [Prunus dulcis]|uniref:NB-ARC domain-containing disease resistance protein n=1 Tax=Prunus dulcis TaxID=3755 RepID=A0A4Y1QWX9_PRUDU|nr:hypothetical protein Prudu_005140 [Prunus dulcis]